MRFRSIRSRIAVSYALLITIALIGISAYMLRYMRSTYVDSLTERLVADAHLVGEIARPALQSADITRAQTITNEVRTITGTRVTLVAPDGVVWGDSATDPAQMPNHLFRPEIQQALRDGRGVTSRYSDTVRYEMLYVAVPVTDQGTLLGFARVAVALDAIDADVARLRRNVGLAAGGIVFVAVILGFAIAEKTVGPVRTLTRAVQRMANGDLAVHMLPHSQDEIGTLTRDLRVMAGRLRETVGEMERQRAELLAILDHMADGIIIADADARVRMVNPAAARMLNIVAADVTGRSFAQVVREHQIIDVLQHCLHEQEEQVELIEVGERGPFLQIIATPLQTESDSGGCLLVLQDLGQIKRLETTRREFVSNISHELRTPLASLRALVDTLRDGALQDPPAALRFLDRMDAEVDALTQMVQELLELSRIESGQVPMALAPVSLPEIVHARVERLRPQAERKDLALQIDMPLSLPPVLADAERLGQVVTNLVHNAIKFTPSGGAITVTGELVGDYAMVSLTDTGRGIPAEALERIFERFYRVDASRSGRGTGLGLAIAKHIVQAHGGEIWAESVQGRGSTFRFTVLLAHAMPSG
jgi:two-component system, OmpR family, phosphate regulon sensor histidine kinase PhoR